MLLADEVKMETHCHNIKVFLEKEAAAFDEKHSLLTVTHMGGSHVLWGCVVASVTENIAEVEGRWILVKSGKFCKQT